MSSAWRSTQIPGVYLTARPLFTDSRGTFTKILGEGDAAAGGPFVTREVFWSQSARAVFRGFHLQLPPCAARKLVFVTHGAVRDFVVDLRRGSPAEGRVHEFRLAADTGGLVIPEGCAHGFEVVSDGASMVYLQEEFHSPEHDSGILYSSVDVHLAAESPVISARDLELPPISKFDSPFELA